MVPFHTVKPQTEVIYNGQAVIKVRKKTAMTKQGKVISDIADNTMVKPIK